MTSLMKELCGKNLLGLDNYKCASGKCVMSPASCERSSKCSEYNKPYYCPDTGWCASTDYRCLRPCGLNRTQSIFDYKFTCPGYPGLCASRLYYCPPVCSGGERYKCLEKRKCAKGRNWCDYCSEHRCKSDGKCISYSKTCDRVNDCSDGGDEVSCSYNINTDNHDRSYLTWDEWQLGGLVGGVFLVFLLCFYCCWKKTMRNSNASAEASAATWLNQQPSSGGPRVTGTTPAAVIRPPVVTVRNAYSPCPSNNAGSNPQMESGFHSEGRLPVVSGTPSGYAAAAAASDPRSYPDAANAVSPEANPTFEPPPSYLDAVQNNEQYQPKDPTLPTYEEVVEGTPADKQSFIG